MTKIGNGTLTLSGSNGFSGVTTVTNGTLKVGLPATSYNAVAHYPFDGNLTDATGNGHNGTFQGGTATYTTGHFSYASRSTDRANT